MALIKFGTGFFYIDKFRMIGYSISHNFRGKQHIFGSLAFGVFKSLKKDIFDRLKL